MPNAKKQCQLDYKKYIQKINSSLELKEAYRLRKLKNSRSAVKRNGCSSSQKLRKTVPEKTIEVKRALSFGIKQGSIINQKFDYREGDIFSRNQDHQIFLELVCDNEINLEDWI